MISPKRSVCSRNGLLPLFSTFFCATLMTFALSTIKLKTVKLIVTFVSLIILLFIVACKKSATSDTSFTGKWKLVETLADPGDGSGQWQPVAAGTYKFIQFNTDSSIQSNLYTDFKKYRVIDSVRIDFIKADGTSLWFRYKVSSSSLEINPPCIEPCGARFIKE